MDPNIIAPGRHEPLRIGAIGAGLAMERLHWPALSRLRHHVVPIAFAEPNDASAARFQGETGLPGSARYPDYRQMLDRADVDAVVILLPIPMLHDAAKASLEAGKHVFCEKPPGGDLDRAQEFLGLERAHPDRILFVAENFFYRDDLRLARFHLDQGVLGRVHSLSWRISGQYVPRAGTFSSTPWRHQPGYRGGPHLDGGIHMMAAMRLLLGDVAKVHGLIQHANSQMGGPSTFVLNLAFASGTVGNYSAIHPEIVVPPDDNGLRLYGDAGTMTLTPPYVQETRGFDVHDINGSGQSWRVSRTSSASVDGGYVNEWLDFVAAVRTGSNFVGSVAQSVMNMVPLLRGLDSAESGGEVDLRANSPLEISASSVPLWVPTGGDGLFHGLDIVETRTEGST